MFAVTNSTLVVSVIILVSIVIIILRRSRKKTKKPEFLVGLAAAMMVFLGVFRTHVPKNKHEISQTGRAKKDQKKSSKL